jgi:hypothetical protein
MVYAMPPQPGNGHNAATNTNQLTWQDSRSTAKARQAMAASLPHGVVVEFFYGKNGAPIKAYVRDAHGHLRTVTFNGQQRVSRIMSGCH